jgi:hypothetical protein
MQFDIAERFVAHRQHPQGDLALVAVGERSQGFGIQLAGAAKFRKRQSVGHQVSAPQVVHPQTQVMFNSRAFSGIKLWTSSRVSKSYTASPTPAGRLSAGELQFTFNRAPSTWQSVNCRSVGIEMSRKKCLALKTFITSPLHFVTLIFLVCPRSAAKRHPELQYGCPACASRIRCQPQARAVPALPVRASRRVQTNGRGGTLK